MTKRQIAVKYLRSGMSLHLIAIKMDVSFQTISRYMKLQVAEGGVSASEVYFGIDESHRIILKTLLDMTSWNASKLYYKKALEEKISWDEANLFWALSQSTANRGDMYEKIADLEVFLHQHIKQILISQFGVNESEWWRQGVPLSVRKSCVQAREEDPDPVESAFAYTTLIHLSEIIDKNWKIFITKLPEKFIRNKQDLLSDLKKLNTIRNAVMHPVKDKTWDENDFIFVVNILNELINFLKMNVETRHFKRSVTFGALR